MWVIEFNFNFLHFNGQITPEMDLYQNLKSHMRNSFEQARNGLIHFQYKKQRLCFFPLECYSHCWTPYACIEFSILRQEFDEYDAAEDVNDAHPRARELTRGQKAERNKSGRENARTRGRADTRREGRAEKKEDFTGRERGWTNNGGESGWLEEDEGEG